MTPFCPDSPPPTHNFLPSVQNVKTWLVQLSWSLPNKLADLCPGRHIYSSNYFWRKLAILEPIPIWNKRSKRNKNRGNFPETGAHRVQETDNIRSEVKHERSQTKRKTYLERFRDSCSDYILKWRQDCLSNSWTDGSKFLLESSF